jgi:DNA-binding phage protein
MYRSEQHADFAKWARATSKYYEANGFLTADRTAQLYGSGALETARSIVAVVESALETSPVHVYWRDWFKKHPGITAEERGIVERARDAGYSRERLYQHNLTVVERVESRHRNLPPPPPPFGVPAAPPVIVAPPAAPKRMVDDVSDLPGMV